MKRAFFLAVCFVLIFSNANAQEASAIRKKMDGLINVFTTPMDNIISPIKELDAVVVTASKIEEKLGAQSSSVTLLKEEDFSRDRSNMVKSALRKVAGLDIVESGAFSGQTSVFIRGGNSNHTNVMIDGIQVYDPIAPNGAINIGHLTLDNIQRIEIVRGPQSTLYGSDAVGGVINIITKKAESPFFKAAFETGAFSTFKESFSMGDVNSGLHYTLGGSFEKSRGISSAQAKNNNPELDGYERMALSSRLDYDISENIQIGATARHTSSLYDYDQFGSDDPNIHGRTSQTLISIYFDHEPLDFYNYHVKCGWMRNFRQDNDANDGGTVDYMRDWFKGDVFTFDFRNNIIILDLSTVTIGYEYTEELADSYLFLDWGTDTSESDMPKVFSRNHAMYLQNRFNFNDRLTATQGLRIDHHSNAGTHATYKLDGSYLFPTGTKLRGAWATGFKAPTLYQLHAESKPSVWGWGGFGGGNPSLQPEKSESYEFGVDQYLFGERVQAYATYFHTMFNGLINTTMDDFYNVSQYSNMGKAHSHGVEIGAKIKPFGKITIDGSYTYNYTKDYSTDRYLLRRPLHKFRINTYCEITPKLYVTIGLVYNGTRFDNGTHKMKSYLVSNIVADYRINENFSTFLKIDNLFDKKYEEVRGMGTSPFAAYIGGKAKF